MEGYSVCAPVSGFHHAGWDYGGGFCTFNGLALAAVVAKEFDQKPGIVDCDMHYGNGTVSILSKLGIEDIPHYTFGGTTFADKGKGDLFVKMLPTIMDRMFNGCGMLLYQAGADPHVDDPLGGALTTAQMKARDDIVFGYAKERKIPVVWCLAGGYSTMEKVLALHKQTYNSWLVHL
jgi:acetoin utilization deacetylase AcuC-like enzyme